MSDADLDKLMDAMSAAGPSKAGRKKEVTYEDFQKVLDSTPLFMRETPKDGSDNEVLEALRSLVFEGEGDEVSLNFKNHGNELFAQKSYRDAITAYTSGLDAGPADTALRTTLLNNRAACNLALKNYGQVLKDAGVIIALAVERKELPPIKAMWRAGKALVGLERWDEARDVAQRGLEMAKGGKEEADWKVLGEEVDKGRKRVVERQERVQRETAERVALAKAIEIRGLVPLNTPSPPDNPYPVHFDPDSLSPGTLPDPSISTLVFPVFLLYPAHSQSDLITHYDELTSMDEHLAAMFPSSPADTSTPWADWDEKHEYWVDNLAVYVETRAQRLLKVGKELTLREVIAKAVKVEKGEDGKKEKRDGVVLRDGLLSFVVLVKGEQERAWIDDFKRKRDGR